MQKIPVDLIGTDRRTYEKRILISFIVAAPDPFFSTQQSTDI